MYLALAATAVAAALLAPVPQDPARAPAPSGSLRRIVMLDGSRPDLDPLREAIAARDPAAAALAVDRARREAEAARRELGTAVERIGGRIVEHFWLIDAVVVEAPATSAERLAALPQAVGVFEDRIHHPGELPLPIRRSTNGNNHRTDAVQARGIRGTGVTVAVVDSGLDSLTGALARPHRTFFVNGDPNNQTGGGLAGSRMLANIQVGAFPADDPIDHGTRVAGVAIGARWNATLNSDDGHAPLAKVVGYGLVDVPGGATVTTTITRAWQVCAADAARFGTKVAVVSYDGFYDPLAPDQQAMDACAEVADLAIAAMAGNTPGSQLYYVGATNVLAVGAVTQDAHLPASFTARGPLTSPGIASRIYPQLVANGEQIEMPTADAESSSTIRSGTSYSAPQVAGAAALFRSVATAASADETRAAILACVDDARGPAPNDADALGHGYLRVDRLIELAQGTLPGVVARGRVTHASPGWSTTIQAQAGEVYAAALAFSRRRVATTSWSNLDLRITQNGVPLGESGGVADTHERVVFRVPASGPVEIAVVARSIESGAADQEFGLAVARGPLPLVSAFGQGCPGAMTGSRVNEVEPMTLIGFGNAGSDQLLGGRPHRTQQWIDTSSPSGAFDVRGLALRHDDAAGTWNRSWVEIDVTFDLTMQLPSSMSTTFAQNLGRMATQVITRKRFVLPPIPAPNTDPRDFRVVLPLDQNFARQYDALPPNPGPGGVFDLIVDLRCYGTSAGAQPLSYPLDAVSGMAGVVSLSAPSPNATSGTLTQGAATVIGLVDRLGTVRVPTLGVAGVPSTGASYELRVGQARAGVPVFTSVGFSRSTLGGIALPLDLAAFGASGCFLWTSLDVTLSSTTSPLGAATFQVTVPNLPALHGGSLFHQALVADQLANALGLAASPALHCVVGQ